MRVISKLQRACLDPPSLRIWPIWNPKGIVENTLKYYALGDLMIAIRPILITQWIPNDQKKNCNTKHGPKSPKYKQTILELIPNDALDEGWKATTRHNPALNKILGWIPNKLKNYKTN